VRRETLLPVKAVLSELDELALNRRGLAFSITNTDGGGTNVVIQQFELPAGFAPQQTSLLLKLPPNFPDAAPDMFWVNPHVKLTSTNAVPVNADQFEIHTDGQQWQRFSRHLKSPWRPGIDDLDSWLATIMRSFESDVGL
jgi:hypothetical protein